MDLTFGILIICGIVLLIMIPLGKMLYEQIDFGSK
jgi:hypothetical protein